MGEFISKKLIWVVAILLFILVLFLIFNKNIQKIEEMQSDNKPDITQEIKTQLSAKYNKDIVGVEVEVIKIVDGYAKGSVNFEGGGGIWFGVYENGNWKLIWDGNGIIKCTEIEEYKEFSNILIPTCWDDTTETLTQR